MAKTIEIAHLTHVYQPADGPVLDDVSLTVDAGEFVTLLGPSGSGKTTLLKLIAGLVVPQRGSIQLGGRDVTHLPMYQRNIGFVFQHYALFPHLTAAANVAFPLRVRRVSRREVDRRVEEVLETVGLKEFARARPRDLSGGQQQRVAVARAIVFNPDVLLLDEPLGALDRRLRDSLSSELRRLQREIGVTTVYVTHDQYEALVLSNRIAVMHGGQIRQIDAPDAVYRRPSERFVAEFLGDINTFECRVVGEERGLLQALTAESLDLHVLKSATDGEKAMQCALRPESLVVSKQPLSADICWRGELVSLVFQGSRMQATVALEGGRHVVAETRDTNGGFVEGASVWVTASADDVIVFSSNGPKSVS